MGDETALVSLSEDLLKLRRVVANCYWIRETTPGHAFTTYNANGEQCRVSIGGRRIGPFGSVTAATDYLEEHARPHASYEIEPEERIVRHERQ